MVNPSSLSRVLIHIGYHKTGTKWFQDVFLPAHPELTVPFSHEQIRRAIVNPNPLTFDPHVASTQLSSADTSGDPEKIQVLSFERLSGSPHAGGYDSKEIADRLKLMFPEARIWISIRNQIAVIESVYKQYVRFGGTATADRYLNTSASGAVPGFRFSFYEYDHLLAYYVDLFGRNNVLITLYEDFAAQPRALSDELCRFLGIGSPQSLSLARVHPSLTDFQCQIMRRMNRFAEANHGVGDPVVELIPRPVLHRRIAVFRRGQPEAGNNSKIRSVVARNVHEKAAASYVRSNRRLETEFEIRLTDDYLR